MAAIITDITMQNASAFYGKLATTNYFQVYISGFKEDFRNKLRTASWGPQLKWETFGEVLGLLCTDATIPASTYATAEVKDNYMGVPQEFAHTRFYTDIDFSFYVDGDYKVLQFFEFWMNYIGAGNNPKIGEPPSSSLGREISPGEFEILTNNYRRFVYPDEYKTNYFYITKFERNYNNVGSSRLQYQLINAFPKAVNAIPVSYGPSELMKVNVTMTYDRYVVSKLVKKKEPAAPPGEVPPSSQVQPAGEQPPQEKSALTDRGRAIINGRSVLSDGARIGPRG